MSQSKFAKSKEEMFPLGPSNFIPILQWASNYSNFTVFAEKVKLFLGEMYPDLEEIVDNIEEYSDIPEVQFNPARLINDPHNFHHKAIERLFTIREDRIAQLEINKKKFFAILLKHLSKESRQQLRLRPDYDEIMAARCPLRLWNAIVDTHYTHTTGIDVLDYHRATQKYVRIAQAEDEALIDFKSRFDATMDAYLGAGGAIPDDNVVAMHFLQALNTKFNEMRHELEKQALNNQDVYPETLNDCFIIAVRYDAISSPIPLDGKGNPVYSTTVEDGKGRPPNSNNNKNQGKKNNNNNGNNNRRKFNKRNDNNNNNNNRRNNNQQRNGNRSNKNNFNRPPTACYCCGNAGHKAKDCVHRRDIPANQQTETNTQRPTFQAYTATTDNGNQAVARGPVTFSTAPHQVTIIRDSTSPWLLTMTQVSILLFLQLNVPTIISASFYLTIKRQQASSMTRVYSSTEFIVLTPASPLVE